MPFSCHAVPLRVQNVSFPFDLHSTAVLCRGLEKNGVVRAWHGRGMTSVNQTRPYCVNQMKKTHSEPLAARHGRRTAWTRHAMCESALIFLWCVERLQMASTSVVLMARRRGESAVPKGSLVCATRDINIGSRHELRDQEP